VSGFVWAKEKLELCVPRASSCNTDLAGGLVSTMIASNGAVLYRLRHSGVFEHRNFAKKPEQ
jgi:hypothetical protein